MSDQSRLEKEDSLLLQVAQGIEIAMENCVTKYGGLVWSIARRYSKDRSAAEDIVQETFTDLWKSASRFDPRVASELTFVGMLARRRGIDFARKQNRQPLFERLPEVDDLDHAAPEPTAAMRCEGQDVREALKKLPEESQKIFSLHFDEGMTHPEIVEATGIPLGTIKTRLRRGLIEVRNILRRLEDGQSSTNSQ